MDPENAYRGFAKFYDAYVQGFTADLSIYHHYCKEDERILEVGCGSGRILQSLAAAGCRVLGVDISDEMLAVAQEKLAPELADGHVQLRNFNFLNGSLEEKFDRVLVTFYTLNYLLDEVGCARFLQNISASMEPGGLILLDLFYPLPLHKPDIDGVWTEKQIPFRGSTLTLRDRRTMRGPIEERIQEYASPEWNQRIVTERRYYSKADMQRILERAGFIDLQFTEGYDINGFHSLETDETDGASFLVKAEKPLSC